MTDYALQLSDVEVQRYLLMAAHARASEADLWTTAGIVPGARVADVGCGPGAVTVTMAEVVGPDGRVDGVDGDPEAVRLATSLISHSAARATVRVGAADATGLEPASYDVAVMRHVLAHNGGREQAIVDHLATLVRPGGSVYLVDADLTAIRMRGAHPAVEEMSQRYVAYQTARGNDMQIGIRLGELLSGAGLEVVDFRGWYTILEPPPGMRPPPWAARDAMVEAQFATVDDVERWRAAYAELDDRPKRPTLFMPGFTAIGRRPS